LEVAHRLGLRLIVARRVHPFPSHQKYFRLGEVVGSGGARICDWHTGAGARCVVLNYRVSDSGPLNYKPTCLNTRSHFSLISLASSNASVSWNFGWRIHRGKPGRPKVPQEIRDLIRMLSRNNPSRGAPRIHGSLLKLGIEITDLPWHNTWFDIANRLHRLAARRSRSSLASRATRKCLVRAPRRSRGAESSACGRDTKLGPAFLFASF
jgi:hypothetical protein